MIQVLQKTEEQVMVALSGKIYIEVATAIREKLFPYLEEGVRSFIINVERVEYIDSSGLGVLVAIQKKAAKQGGGVTIEGLNGHVKELFELTRLTRVFDIK